MDKTVIVLIVLAALAVLNAISFGLMAHDKRCAKKGKWRVPEMTLFLATACFGGLGGVLGMRLLRHRRRAHLFQMQPSRTDRRASSSWDR